jgi:flavin-dependent dehydrogenase
MRSCDALIVGGGPGGSSCAWKLRQAGLDVVVIDRARFPRNKICAGWVTPAVLTSLQIDQKDYAARGRVLQPITGFRTSVIEGQALETRYGAAVSFGIRRCEFDHYLLQRSGACVCEGVALNHLQRVDGRWIVNGQVSAPVIVGAGGHFCPVARAIGAAKRGEAAVVAQEIEFELDRAQAADCSIAPDTPELYLCSDLKGYGWCFRKQGFINIGLGRLDRHELTRHIAAFVAWLKRAKKISSDVPDDWRGHAYLLYETTRRHPVGDGVLLVGDAAGLAYAQSGEGIRTAVESGLLAADTIIAAAGDYSAARLDTYRDRLHERFGDGGASSAVTRFIPGSVTAALGRSLLRTRWFTRHVFLDRWFLHAHQPPLSA